VKKLLANAKISNKLLLISLAATIFLVLSWAVAYVGLTGLKSVSDNIYTSTFRGYQQSSQILQSLAASHADLYKGLAVAAIDDGVKQAGSLLKGQTAAVEQAMNTVKELSNGAERTPEEIKYYQTALGFLAEYMASLKDAGDAADASSLRADITIADEKFIKLRTTLDGLLSLEDRLGKETHEFSSRTYWKTLLISSAILILAAGLFLLVTKAVTRTMLSPIHKMVGVIQGISNGDLTKRIDALSGDEIGEMGKHLNASMDKLLNTIAQFAKSSLVISSTATALDGATKQITSGVERTAFQANSVATSSEEMSATSSEIANNCVTAAKSSEKANTAATTGESIIKETIAVMDRIHGIVNASAKIIETLGEKSDQIGEVINLIGDIADQTNLLALNAAIEAARAGEHGRGFAVVADEVRKLAEKTSEATRQIGTNIEGMQAETKQAVSAMEGGVKEVGMGTEEAKKSGDALRDILKQINTVTVEIGQIAIASEQQTATTNKIAANIQQISEAMREAAKNVGENASAASQLARLSTEMQKIVAQFKLATQDDARDMVERAIAYVKTHGKEKAFADFIDPKGEFIKNGMFIFAQDFNGVMLVHAGNHSLIGKNAIEIKDVHGKYHGKEMINLAKTKGSGWVEYAAMNPFTQVIQEKTTYVQSAGDYLIACGVYK
jgi:methyl-accepting chemotaxis protein